MSAARPIPIFTVDQYLAYERESAERHEYLDGEILGMAGESANHGDITSNTLGSVHAQLKGTPCRARVKDTKVRSGPEPRGRRNTSGLYSYPDIVVICGEPEYHDHHQDIVINPAAIAEVLSPSTEEFDREVKLPRYQKWNQTLRDHVLISQDEPLVEHSHRQDDGTWITTEYRGLDAVIPMPNIGCLLKLADVYDRIKFTRE
jgi:Uma2 family endonuclease